MLSFARRASKSFTTFSTSFVNGTEIQHTLLPCSNGTRSYLYFNYSHSTKEIVIIPELASLIILPPFMIATLLAVTVYRRRVEAEN